MTQDVATVAGLLMGVSSFVAGAITWYKGAIVKSYAAERDFNHLRRNLEQLSNNLSDVSEEVDHRFDRLEGEMIQIKALLQAQLSTGQSITGGYRDH